VELYLSFPICLNDMVITEVQGRQLVRCSFISDASYLHSHSEAEVNISHPCSLYLSGAVALYGAGHSVAWVHGSYFYAFGSTLWTWY
jgi:hypothetical protein